MDESGLGVENEAQNEIIDSHGYIFAFLYFLLLGMAFWLGYLFGEVSCLS